MPQYHLGHLGRVARIGQRVASLPAFALREMLTLDLVFLIASAVASRQLKGYSASKSGGKPAFPTLRLSRRPAN